MEFKEWLSVVINEIEKRKLIKNKWRESTFKSYYKKGFEPK